MTLAAGSHLAGYEIVALLGAGGMGEVYRARDTKLGREVAIKVLPEELARDKARLDRFEREARVLAQLNHSNVASLHGLEEHDGQPFLVMELVEGETLAERIARGPIPLEEIAPLFIQIAEGLEAAHEKGIIHRDLKPANVKIGPGGKPKILDFGLAKALATEQDASAGTSRSPTLTKGTALGVIMGTASYMSPEQARGRAVEGRTDVWAFGVCLYEAVTGKRPFVGDNVTDVLAAVVRAEPDWNLVPAWTPSRLLRLMRRCLEKDTRERMQHIGDARLELSDACEPEVPPRPRSRPRATAAVVGAVVGASLLSAFLATRFSLREESLVRPVRRFAVAPPEGQSLTELLGNAPTRYPSIAISPDGSRLVLAASDGTGASRLYLRSFDAFEAQALPGTEGGEAPFFSPDGNWIAFWSKDAVFKVPVNGGMPVEVGKVRRGARGGAWTRDGAIVLGGVNRGLLRMDPDGGDAIQITQLDLARGDEYHAWPEALPDGEHVLFTVATGDTSEIAALSLEAGEWHVVEGLRGATQSRYLDTGFLVFYRAGSLFAAPFALANLSLTGPEIPALDALLSGENAGLEIGYFTASPSGVLAYVPYAGSGANHIVTVDRNGEETPLSIEPGNFRYGIALSPDGRRLAAGIQRERGSVDLWILDVSRGTRSRLTSQGSNIRPVWSGDARSIYYAAFPSESFDVYQIPADGGGEPEAILTGDAGQSPTSLSRDGRVLVVTEAGPETGEDIHLLSMDEAFTNRPFLTTEANEDFGRMSPDDRFLAYVSDESGRNEVYVRPITGDGGKTPISTNGGDSPCWSPRGDELFYWRGTALMRVGVRLEPSFEPTGPPERLFEGRYRSDSYDVAADGQHFIVVTRAHPELTQLNVVFDWQEELKRPVPVK